MKSRAPQAGPLPSKYYLTLSQTLEGGRCPPAGLTVSQYSQELQAKKYDLPWTLSPVDLSDVGLATQGQTEGKSADGPFSGKKEEMVLKGSSLKDTR